MRDHSPTASAPAAGEVVASTRRRLTGHGAPQPVTPGCPHPSRATCGRSYASYANADNVPPTPNMIRGFLVPATTTDLDVYLTHESKKDSNKCGNNKRKGKRG